METAQDICGMTKGPPRHKETWWWNEEVAEAVRNKERPADCIRMDEVRAALKKMKRHVSNGYAI